MIASTTILFGPTTAAFQYAENLRRALPPLNAAQVQNMIRVFEGVFGRTIPETFDLNEIRLRRPHFTACYRGIFGGGATAFPGEFALARHGVLLLAELEHFKPEIAPALAEKLQTPASDDYPIVLIHLARAADLPETLAALSSPRIQLG